MIFDAGFLLLQPADKLDLKGGGNVIAHMGRMHSG